jgi:Ca2+/Na+ antiporter
MQFLDFTNISILLNLAIFAIAAVIIWFTGTRLSIYGDVISDRTNLGRAFMGLLFLALATEMPEIGTTISAALAKAMGIVMTGVYLAGLIERRNRTILRMGVESAIVLVLYVVSLFILYQLR